LLSNLAGEAIQAQTPYAPNEDRDRAEKLYQERNYMEASALLEKVVKRSPNDFDAWYLLGLSDVRRREFKKSGKAFESAVKLKPDSAPAHTGLALVYLLRNKPKDAIKKSEVAISIDANNSEAHAVLAAARLRTGDRDEALAEAETALKLNDKLADAYLVKAQALVQFSRDVIVRTPKDPDFTGNRYQEAATALDNYLKLAPNSPDKQLWNDQLQALSFHAAARSKEGWNRLGVYTSKEVTTKLRLISKPEPSYTEVARGNMVTGTVVLKALFTSEGAVKHIVVVYGLPDGLTWEAVRAAKKIKFVPANLNGQPVSMLLQLEYNFNIY
jgi:tetratricopeptide (TPR) repeat protein